MYFDNASTTSVDNTAISIISQYLKDYFYNPSSIYYAGQKNSTIIQEAKRDIAKSINATNTNQIYITSGGTEGNNWAIRGFIDYLIYVKKINFKPHIITSSIEHHSVLNVCEFLEKANLADITYVKPNSQGYIENNSIEQYINSNTVLISIMSVNNVLGTINDIQSIGNLCFKYNICFHTDAVQGIGKIPIDVNKYRIDFLTCSGHKLHSPKGIGFLYVKNPNSLQPLLYGGLQENGLRAGTENLPYIKALQYCINKYSSLEITKNNAKQIQKITNYLKNKLEKTFTDKLILVGDIGTINIAFKSIISDTLVWELGQNNVFVSVGSACDNGSLEDNYVLKEINMSNEYIGGNIRITYNENNTIKECQTMIDILQKIIIKLRGYL